jgi:glucose-1-phosphate adenylyltransferase
VLAIVLAGGEGKRLSPLTLDRAKPAVPFGGNYRLIDFALSNLVNAGYRRIVVLTQYKSHSLDRHISQTWRLSPLLGNYVAPVPAQMRRGPHWFQGSADAIYQNLNLLRDERPEYVIVFGADHIYRMDPAQMVRQHVESGAAVTVAALRVADRAGRPVRRDRDARRRAHDHRFREKPKTRRRAARRARPGLRVDGQLRLLGETLIEIVTADAAARDSSTTSAATSSRCSSSPTGRRRSTTSTQRVVPGATDRDRGYWRDVGTLDAFYDAHMDLISVSRRSSTSTTWSGRS